MFSLAVSAYAAPPIPGDCDRRMQAMDDNIKVALLVTDPDLKFYKNEQEFNEEYCM